MSLDTDAKDFLRQFRAFIRFAQGISDVADLKADVKELSQAKEDLASKLSDMHEELEATRQGIKKANASLFEAEKKAVETLADAEKKAKEILDLARDQALTTRVEAKAAIDQDQAMAQKRLEEIRREIDRLDKEKAKLVVDKSNLEAAINDMKKKFL